MRNPDVRPLRGRLISSLTVAVLGLMASTAPRAVAWPLTQPTPAAAPDPAATAGAPDAAAPAMTTAPTEAPGAAAPADPGAPPATVSLRDEELSRLATTEDLAQVIPVTGAVVPRGRGIAEDFIVMPSGVDVGARLRLITADDALGAGKLKLTDLVLFDVTAAWAFARRFQLDLRLSVLPKQPSTTDEEVFQGGALAVRRELTPRLGLAVAGAVAPLLGLDGLAFGTSAALLHKRRLNEVVAFSLSGGATAQFFRPSSGFDDDPPFLVEGTGHLELQVRVPNGFWGGWLGAGYSLPIADDGADPVSGMALDPQPRLDLTIGTGVQLSRHWDLSFDASIFDRGDLTAPATRLPILDGGFDQLQLAISLTRRVELKKAEGSQPMILE